MKSAIMALAGTTLAIALHGPLYAQVVKTSSDAFSINPKPAMRTQNFKDFCVTLSSTDAARAATGVSIDALRTRIDLRARAAGLNPIRDSEFPKTCLSGKNSDGNHMSFITVEYLGGNVVVNANFARTVAWFLPENDKSCEPGSICSAFMPTWGVNGFVIYPGSPSSVFDLLDRVMDKFLNAYLEANQ